jgi:hypothetical protein
MLSGTQRAGKKEFKCHGWSVGRAAELADTLADCLAFCERPAFVVEGDVRYEEATTGTEFFRDVVTQAYFEQPDYAMAERALRVA